MMKGKGISLIEIIVALLVSSIIMLAIMQLYTSFYQSSRNQELLSTAQDKANFALNELARGIRMSGAGLCAKPTEKKLYSNPSFNMLNNKTYYNTNSVPYLKNKAFSSYNDIRLYSDDSSNWGTVNTSTTPATVSADLATIPLVANSDILFVSYTLPDTLRVEDIGTGGSSGKSLDERMSLNRFDPLHLSSPLSTILEGKSENIWLMVSDCDYSEVVYYPTYPGKSNNIIDAPADGFKRRYYHPGQSGLVAPVISKAYFVAKGSDGLALYEKNMLDVPGGTEKSEEVMDGVASIKVEYLTDTGSWVNTPASWKERVPVKLTLTMEDGTQDENAQRSFVRIIDPRN